MEDITKKLRECGALQKLEKGLSLIKEESDIANRGELFTNVDAQYLKEGYDYLKEFYDILMS